MAGPMIPLSQTLLLASYPPAKAGMAMAMWAMTTLVAPVVGPLLGGWITDNISWPWIFYINVPVGLLAAALTWSIYRTRDPAPRKVPIDCVGLVLLVLWVGALQIMIDKGKELDWFGSHADRRAGACVAAVGFAVLPGLGADRRASDRRPAPVRAAQLPGRHARAVGRLRPVLRQRGAAAAVAAAVHGLHRHLGRHGDGAGGSAGDRAVALGRQERRASIDPRTLATVAFVGFALVLWMRSHFNTQADFGTILLPTFLQGAAMAFFFIPLQAIVFSGLTPEQMPSGLGPVELRAHHAPARSAPRSSPRCGTDRAALHHAQLAEIAAIAATQRAMQALARAGRGGPDARAGAGRMLNRLVDQQAYTMAATDLFYLSALLFLGLIGAGLAGAAAPQGAAAADAGGAH